MGDLFRVLKQYSALVPTKEIKISPEIKFEELHNFLLTNILQNVHLTLYPPSSRYQEAFWKWAIKTLESMLRDEVGIPFS